VPVQADYDGDGRADLAVYRQTSSEWYVILSSTGTGWSVQWGGSGDRPVPADFDGDGKTDATVWRPSSGLWYVLKSSSGNLVSQVTEWGVTGDIPLPRVPY
jgi:hypothetical protein